MNHRSEEFVTAGQLTVHLVSPEGVFLFKSVAGRTEDIEDMSTLVQIGLDFEAIEREIDRQVTLLGEEFFVTIVNESLVELEDRFGVTVPIRDAVAKRTTAFTANSKFEEARAHWEAERFNDALDIFFDLPVEIDDLRSALDEVEAAFVDIAREVAEIMLMEDILDGFELLIEGFIPFTRGSIAFHEGTDHFTERDYERAIDRYESARTEFTQVNDIFSAAMVSHPIEEFDFENFACISDLFVEAVGYLKASAQAELDNEVEEAEEYRQQATELLESERCA